MVKHFPSISSISLEFGDRPLACKGKSYFDTNSLLRFWFNLSSLKLSLHRVRRIDDGLLWVPLDITHASITAHVSHHRDVGL